MRDQKIPVIAFVANTGGLLGLCMGFSLVSVFEIVYHALGAMRKWWGERIGKRFRERRTTTTVVAGTNHLHVAAGAADNNQGRDSPMLSSTC
jgi:hypothetical protein